MRLPAHRHDDGWDLSARQGLAGVSDPWLWPMEWMKWPSAIGPMAFEMATLWVPTAIESEVKPLKRGLTPTVSLVRLVFRPLICCGLVSFHRKRDYIGNG